MRSVLLVLFLAACAPGAPADSPTARCPDVDLGVLLSECRAVVSSECGTPARADCHAKDECHARVRAWLECQ